MKIGMMTNEKNNLPESEMCFAVAALLLNFSVIAIAIGVLWYLVSQFAQNLPMLIITHEIH